MPRANVKWFSTRQKGKRKGGRRSPMQLVGLRLRDLARLFRARYGTTLPDDDAGRDDMLVALHHLVRLRGHSGQAERWIEIWAPWLPVGERDTIIADVTAEPEVWTADELAVRLRLTMEERTMLGITTIGAVDQTRAERREARRQKDRQRKARIRREKGAKTRAEYLADSRESKAPWVSAGISRSEWYRQKNERETGSAAA